MEREERHVDHPTTDERTETDAAVPRTWNEAEERTREFEALLQKYDGDFQKATDAQLRGERVDTSETRGSASIF